MPGSIAEVALEYRRLLLQDAATGRPGEARLPMRLVTAREMQSIDRLTIGGGHVPSLALMESAGTAAAHEAIAMVEGQRDARVEVLCGKGNNGGDGFVLARVLAQAGMSVHVFLSHPPDDLSPDARTNYERLAATAAEVQVLPQTIDDPGAANDPRDRGSLVEIDDPATSALQEALNEADLCVDALLGTGVSGPLQGRMGALVNVLNHASTNTLALDIPSGVNGDNGAVEGVAVWADATVTFGLPKVGLAFHPGCERAGRVTVADIGFPPEVIGEHAPRRFLVERDRARSWLPRLEPTAHKYRRGVVVVVAGSGDFPGAAALAAQGAQRAGAGLVHLVVPRGIRTLLQTKLTEVIVYGVSESTDGAFAAEAALEIRVLLERAQALVIGPGLGTSDTARACAREVLSQCTVPMVVDADAIAALPNAPRRAPCVVTPHAGELARWLGATVPGTPLERMQHALKAAQDQNVVLLAKGAPALTATPNGDLYVNGTGHAGLASGGSGDVLAGMIGALLAQGVSVGPAAALASWVHGRAAELACVERGTRSLVAHELCEFVGPALFELES